MRHLLRDFRYGLRGLLRSPGMTTVAVLSLVLGVGANAVVFSLVNALLLRPLPVAHPQELVRIGRTHRGDGFFPFSYPEYRELTQAGVGEARALSGIVGHQPNNAILAVGDDVRQEWMEIVTPNYFSVLGVAPRLGRGLMNDDQGPASPEIVISDGFWRRRLNGDANVVGRVVRLNGHPLTIAGVAPAGFSGTFTGFDIALWVPVGLLAQALPGEPPLTDRNYRFLMLIGRLADKTPMERAHVALATAAARWTDTASRADSVGRVGVALRQATGVHPYVAGVVTVFASLLMVIVGLVLLIACANVANLLLVRGAVRRREMAIRLSLGARRGRLVRQLLAESALLAAAGGAGGVLLTFWLTRLLLLFRPPVGVPLWLDVTPDGRVLAFTGAIALGATLLFGLAPALHTSRTDLTAALKGLAPGGPRSRTRSALVVSQVAVSTLLLVCAALLIRTLVNSRSLQPGFDVKHTLVLSPEPGRLGYDEARTRALWERLSDRLGRIPDVERVTLALMIPLGDRADQMAAARAQDENVRQRMAMMDYNIVSPGYFPALGMRLSLGREFEPSDRDNTPRVAVVTEALARRFWPGTLPIGQRIRLIDRGDSAHVLEVVGVVSDLKYRSLGEEPRPVIYLPHTQWYRSDMRVQIGTRGEPRALLAAVRQAVRETDPDIPVTSATLEEETAFTLVPAKIAGSILAGAGAIALVLAAVGLFGVISFNVARRSREIGIRMALGARARNVGAHVIREGLVLTAIGLVIGLGVALGATRLLRGLLYGVGPSDPLSFGVIAMLYVAVSALASYVPARRATRVDPVVVLREE